MDNTGGIVYVGDGNCSFTEIARFTANCENVHLFDVDRDGKDRVECIMRN